MASLVNYTKSLRLIEILHELQTHRRGGDISQPVLWDQYDSDRKTRQRYHRKKKTADK